MTKTAIAAATLLVIATGPGLATGPSAAAAPAWRVAERPVAGPDFDADGYADLAAGAPGGSADGLDGLGGPDGGTVIVLYGMEDGIAPARAQEWNQASDGIESDPENAEDFGTALSAGDFNGDGFDDLAIGAPRDHFYGIVHVLYGGTDGLSSAGSEAFKLGEDGLPNPSESADLGRSLSSADFDGDGYDELVMAAPSQHLEGEVYVLPGGPDGLTTTEPLVLTEDDVGGQPPNNRGFGSALAPGDVDGDGHPELVIGAPVDRQKRLDAGAIFVVPGSSSGLLPAEAVIWSQQTPGVPGKPAEYDLFGGALAAGDLDGDGFDDVAVGGPGDQRHADSKVESGAVWVFYGSMDGLVASTSKRWHQGIRGIAGKAEDGDSTGSNVAVADIDADGYADLALSSPLDTFTADGARRRNAGNVNIIYGSDAGLTAAGNQLWSQKSEGVSDSPEKADLFGRSLALLDGNGDGSADLAVGVSQETNADKKWDGAVHVLYGTESGLIGTGSSFFVQGVAGVPGSGADSARLGYAVAGAP